MKKLRVTVDGKVFDVLVEMLDEPANAATPARAPVAVSAPVAPPSGAAPAAAPGRPPSPAGAGTICSPLAGKVVSIDVPLGGTVAAGTQVATIEAMKMNTFVYSDKAGRVTAVHAKAGDAVEEGGVLLDIG